MNKASFNILSTVQEVKVAPNEITGTYDKHKSYINMFLHFDFIVPRHDEVYLDIVSISAKLKLNASVFSILSEVNVPVGLTIPRQKYDTGVWLNFPMEEKAIAIIEKERKGDLNFIVEFTVLYSLRNNIYIPIHKLSAPFGMGKVHENLYISIPRSVWIEKILAGLAFRSLKLIEIPVDHKVLKEAYAEIIFEFDKAEHYFTLHDYDKCVSHCRHTLDALHRNLKEIKKSGRSESAFKWLENVDTATITWIDELDKRTVALASKTHHAGHKKEFSREEAQSIYLIVLGLLNFVGNLKP